MLDLGSAAAVCAETLRQEGFRGQIVVATRENHLPYDRPKLSKVGIGLLTRMLVMFLPLFVCLSVCLSVSKITRKVMDASF